MTVNALRRLLDRAAAEGKGRMPVLVFKRTFKDAREGDGLCMFHVESIATRDYLLLDENGYGVHGDGKEHWRSGIVLAGNTTCRHGYEHGLERCPRCSRAGGTRR